MTELGLPSLRATLDQTWAEYLIRVHGYLRQKEQEDLKARRTWYNTLIAPNVDPKTLPRSEQAYMPLPSDQRKVDKLKTGMQELIARRLQEAADKKAQHGRESGSGD